MTAPNPFEPIPFEPIRFEPGRFRSAAMHYLEGRPEYAPALFPAIALLCGLDGTGQMLDLGCGPGQLATAFRPFLAGALGMDPEPEMLALARRRAAADGVDVVFQDGASHDLKPGMGPFRLVTIGRAFHWMDRLATLHMLDRIIEPGGALVLLQTSHPDVPDNAWRAEYEAGMERATGTGRRQVWRQPGYVRHEAVLLDSPFCTLHKIGLIERRHTPGAQFVDRALSMSSTTRARLGEDGVGRLTAEIEQIVAAASMDGLVTEVVESTALIARR